LRNHFKTFQIISKRNPEVERHPFADLALREVRRMLGARVTTVRGMALISAVWPALFAAFTFAL